MGEKLDHYIDTEGNIIFDDDPVIFDGREYRTAYISHEYVNLDGGRRYGRLHLPFKCGVPVRKIKNAPKTSYPEQGTIKEIGAKVGDTVEWISCGESTNHYVAEICGNEAILIEDGNDPSESFKWPMDSKYGMWRIISRADQAPEATTSPIRTVTQKEIVPGVYGKVKVTTPKSSLPGVAGIDLTCDGWWTATELRAAAKTLTEIADALDDG